MMKIKPLNDVIAVKMDGTDKTTASGIILASVNETPQRAIVLAVGNEVEDINEGDVLVLTPFAKLTSMKHEGEDVTFIRVSDVVAKLN